MRIEELRKQILISAVVEEMGGEISGTHPGWRPTRCPFHDDRTPSASTSDEDGRFWCHDAACEIGGDIIDLAKVHLSTSDTREAMDWLAETFGVEDSSGSTLAEELL